ncbi:hypothetical protein F4804DRAFT_302582 [Jackrogersella minutella]|nr:hypothetical protein F4804DRAFT_302582 [Jackrogersella minutella]
MPSKKRKSEDDPTASAVVNSDSTSKKRRRVSDADEVALKPEKKHKKDKKEKKDKKSKKTSSKKEKDHKRKAPVEEEDAVAPEPTVAEDAAPEVNGASEDTPIADAPPTTVEGESEKSSKKSKKDKKDKKDKKEKKKDKKKSTTEPSTTEPSSTSPNDVAQPEDPGAGSEDSKKAHRFIVFVGNLPYSATTEQISAHFSIVHPISVRLLHNAQTKKSRGVAFVEFARFDHMKSCLKTLHHSTFTCPAAPGARSQAPDERKINVELTAGGGGNTAHRKDKIRAKNEKLKDERARRIESELDAKAEKEREDAKNGAGEEKKKKTSGGIQEDAIHPSRRMRVPGA